METEQQLIERARTSLSECRWTLGECAGIWTKRHARGRTDADFASLVGLSTDQVYQRRRVWERFHEQRENYANCSWSHFYTALNWDDAETCLAWAHENESSVAEMKAWWKVQHGEPLDGPVSDENDELIRFVPDEPTSVMHPDDFAGSGAPRRAGGVATADDLDMAMAGVAREASGDDPYTPYLKGGENRGSGPTAAIQLSPEQTIKRIAGTLDRCLKLLTPDVAEDYRNLPVHLRQRFRKAVEELQARVDELEN